MRCKGVSEILNHKIKKSHEPLYMQVTNLLLEEITEGVFKEEERLPSEDKLAKMLGVSRATVREALSALEDQGQLKRVHGVGTMITHQNRIPIGTGMERLASYTEYVEDFGFEPGTKEKAFEWVVASERQQVDFDGDPEMVGVLKRVRTANGEPLMYSEDVLPQGVLGEGFTLERLGESLFEYLKSVSVQLAYSELLLTATVACVEMATKLEVEVGAPLLDIEETYFDQHGTVVLWSRNIYRVDRWVFKMFRTT